MSDSLVFFSLSLPPHCVRLLITKLYVIDAPGTLYEYILYSNLF